MNSREAVRLTPEPANEKYRIILGPGYTLKPEQCQWAIKSFTEDPNRFVFFERQADRVLFEGVIDKAVKQTEMFQGTDSSFDLLGYEIGMLMMQRVFRSQIAQDKENPRAKFIKMRQDSVTDLSYTRFMTPSYSDNPEVLFSIWQGDFIKELKPYLAEGKKALSIPEANSFWAGAMDYNYMINASIRRNINEQNRATPKTIRPI